MAEVLPREPVAMGLIATGRAKTWAEGPLGLEQLA